ncbi:MAG: FkbM family methyltransferase [Paracoccaceae bacterium]|jgi:FkbM family methyltransferase|nr:FkbM family methyltransferase [Paracoccaceae bacterium]MDP7185680.1 FkbM family methyltransferase [Paracoccaceae bacterium]
MLANAIRKFGQARQILTHASPALPLIKDSVRLQFSDYEATFDQMNLTFQMNHRQGDWFTFYECCIRQDYFPDGIDLMPGDTVLDLGGNFGAFSVMAAQIVGAEGAVHCFEPAPQSQQRIRENARRNGIDNIHLHPVAVGGESGTIRFHTHTKSALSSIYDELDGRDMSAVSTIEVEIRSINDVMRDLPKVIHLAKIDCEGAEHDIFQEITDENLARIRAIVMELHNVPGKVNERLFDRLAEAGFAFEVANPVIAVNRSAI